MKGYGEDEEVRNYGDGSVTSPTTWWVALGRYGVWMPAWNKQNEGLLHRNEKSYHGPAIWADTDLRTNGTHGMDESTGHTDEKLLCHG